MVPSTPAHPSGTLPLSTNERNQTYLLCVRTVLCVIYNGTHNVMANVSPKLMLDTSTST